MSMYGDDNTIGGLLSANLSEEQGSRGVINPLSGIDMSSLAKESAELRRATEAAAKAQNLSESEIAQAVWEAHRRRYQISLDDPRSAGLADLEDPRLLEHMAAARLMLAAHEKQLLEVPGAKDLGTIETDINKLFGQLKTAVTATQKEVAIVGDHTQLEAENLQRVLGGIQPFGYPAIGLGLRPAVQTASDRVTTVGTLAIKTGEDLLRAVSDLVRVQHGAQLAINGWKRRAEFYQQSYEDAVKIFQQ